MARRFQRGFTLVELMVVVGMIGVLAALALVGYRKYINSAKSSEARAVMQGIRVGEAAYRAETLVYLGCSGGASLGNYYPRATPDAHKASFVNSSHAQYSCWRTLNVTTDAPTYYVFSVVAGPPQASALSLTVPGMATQPTWPIPREPWFVVQALGDVDGDGVQSNFVSSSFSGEIYAENDSE